MTGRMWRRKLGKQALPPSVKSRCSCPSCGTFSPSPSRSLPPYRNLLPLSQGGKRILLVEDNTLNQEIAAELLLEAGFSVEVAADGSVAVEKMRHAQPGQYDLILMDIQMPVLNGHDATRQIRAMDSPYCKAIPILAMTANAFEEDRQDAIAAGMSGHLAKPIDLKALTNTLATALCGQDSNVH